MNVVTDTKLFFNVFQHRTLQNLCRSNKISWKFEKLDILQSVIFDRNNPNIEEYNKSFFELFGSNIDSTITKIQAYMLLPTNGIKKEFVDEDLSNRYIIYDVQKNALYDKSVLSETKNLHILIKVFYE